MKHQNPTTELAPLDSNAEAILKDSREDTFLRLIFQGIGVREAGISAGYSQRYSETGIYTKFKSDAFQQKVREFALASNSQAIPKVCDIYSRTINQLHKEVGEGKLDNLGKLKHIPTQILQIGKVLSPEIHQNVINLVNIESMQTLIQAKLPKTTDSDAE